MTARAEQQAGQTRIERVATTLRAALALACVAGAVVRAQDAPAFEVQPLVGAALRGSLDSIDGAKLEVGGQSVELRRICYFHGPAKSIVPIGRVELRLHSGERVVGDVLGGDEDGEGMTVRSVSCGRVQVSLDDLALLRVRGAAGFPSAARYRAEGDSDVVFRETALGFDPIKGVLESVDTKGLRFEVDGGASELFPWKAIAGLRLPPEEPERVEGLQLVVLLSDGSRLRGRPKAIDTKAEPPVLLLEHARLGTLRIEVSSLLAGHVVDPSTRRFVSALTPKLVQERDQFSDKPIYSWQRDANVFGKPLVVRRRFWTSGLGVHSKSSLDFVVPAGCTKLLAWIGADDSATTRRMSGDMHFRVLRGGEVLAEAPSVKGGQRAQALPPIPVKAGQTIRFEVDFGAGLHTLDRGNWLAPVFVR